MQIKLTPLLLSGQYTANAELFYNNSGSLSGSSNLTYDYINNIFTAGIVNSSLHVASTNNLTFSSGATIIDSTGTQGTTGQVLTTNGSGNIYWSTVSGGGGGGLTGAQIAANNWTFTNAITISGNSVISANLSVNAAIATITIGNTSTTTYSTINSTVVNATTFTGTANNSNYIGGNSAATIYSTFAQNTSVYSTFAQNTAIYAYAASNTYVNSTFAQNTSVYSTFAQNTAIYAYAASNTYVNSTFAQNTAIYAYAASNTYVNSTFQTLAAVNTSIAAYLPNYTGVVNGSSHAVGTTFTANSTLVNAAAINITGQTNTATLYVTTSANVGTTFTANSTLVNAVAISTANLITTTNVVTIGTGVYFVSNGNIGVANTAPATKLMINGNYAIAQTTIATTNNIVINCSTANFFQATANGSAANISFSSIPSNSAYSFVLVLANGGTNTISWFNTPKWPSAAAPIPSANTDIWVFFTPNGGTTWYGNQVNRDVR